MKVLNLYAGIGGNRKLWPSKCQVTAVEINPDIASIYAHFFPKDNIIIGDAHSYLEANFDKFDFIWSSPPCITHSSFRQNICVRYRGTKPIYPDMKLYQEILFLKYNYKGKWIIENVRPYYSTLIPPDFTLQRHIFWSSKPIKEKQFSKGKIRTAQISYYQEHYGFDLGPFRLSNKRQLLRNCVDPEIGEYIYEVMMNKKKRYRLRKRL